MQITFQMHETVATEVSVHFLNPNGYNLHFRFDHHTLTVVY